MSHLRNDPIYLGSLFSLPVDSDSRHLMEWEPLQFLGPMKTARTVATTVPGPPPAQIVLMLKRRFKLELVHSTQTQSTESARMVWTMKMRIGAQPRPRFG